MSKSRELQIIKKISKNNKTLNHENDEKIFYEKSLYFAISTIK